MNLSLDNRALMSQQGADLTATGAKGVWTGKYEKPLGQRALESLGFSQNTAGLIYGAPGLATEAYYANLANRTANTTKFVGEVPSATKGGVQFDGTATIHETKIANEFADQGSVVRIRGENLAGPDAQIDGNWYYIKELSGEGKRSLQTSINSFKNNFTNQGAADLGLNRSDTRAVIDAKGNNAWDNPDAIRSEFDRLSMNGDLNNVAEVSVITSEGPIVWIRP